MFDDVRLPEDIERGARGGPMFNTTIVGLISGAEKRLQNWSRSRGRWDVGYGVQDKDGYSRVLAFFYARRGRAHGFRFKDWSDFEVTHGAYIEDRISAMVSKYYLAKPYGNYLRRITKPTTNMVKLSDDTMLNVDRMTGEIAAIPAGNATWSGEFDVPVRFDTDNLEVDLNWYDAGSIPSFPIVELRT